MMTRLLSVAVCVWIAGLAGLARPAHTQAPPQTASPSAPCPGARDHDLPLPTSMTPDAFHDRLLAFLQGTEYVTLGWCSDKGVRDTGPFVNGTYLGTHPAVRVYYSPEVMT